MTAVAFPGGGCKRGGTIGRHRLFTWRHIRAPFFRSVRRSPGRDARARGRLWFKLLRLFFVELLGVDLDRCRGLRSRHRGDDARRTSSPGARSRWRQTQAMRRTSSSTPTTRRSSAWTSTSATLSASSRAFEWNFVNAGFDSIIPGIQSGKYDVGMSSFTDNKLREKVVDFVTYFTAGTSFYIGANAAQDQRRAVGAVRALGRRSRRAPPSSTT